MPPVGLAGITVGGTLAVSFLRPVSKDDSGGSVQLLTVLRLTARDMTLPRAFASWEIPGAPIPFPRPNIHSANQQLPALGFSHRLAFD
ncbi:hypothetical protein LZ32DRAFT_599343, partial [Colletotrichum eremochloae]